MANNELVVLSVGLALSVALVGAITYYLPKLRRAASEQRQAADILTMMLSELRQRQTQQDQRIMDHQVRLDVLELRVAGSQEGREVQQTRTVDSRGILEEIRGIIAKEGSGRLSAVTQRDAREKEAVLGFSVPLNETERRVMSLLNEGPKTPKEVQSVIGRSREHTARLLNQLFQGGYVVRDDIKRPFVYQLSRKGREAVA